MRQLVIDSVFKLVRRYRSDGGSCIQVLLISTMVSSLQFGTPSRRTAALAAVLLVWLMQRWRRLGKREGFWGSNCRLLWMVMQCTLELNRSRQALQTTRSGTAFCLSGKQARMASSTSCMHQNKWHMLWKGWQTKVRLSCLKAPCSMVTITVYCHTAAVALLGVACAEQGQPSRPDTRGRP